MKFVRLAMLYFSPVPIRWEPFRLQVDTITASTLTVGEAPPVEGKLRVLLATEIPLPGLPCRDDEGFVVVPETERRKCESVLEMVARVIAVTARCTFSIASPMPPAAFIPDTPEEHLFLNTSEGVRPAYLRNADRIQYQVRLSAELFVALSDRLAGVELLAEAMRHGDAAMAKYRELVRVLELAFARSVPSVARKLTRYLAGSKLGYTRDEVNRWLSFRHGAMHAELEESTAIVVEADIRPFIERMEQATVDVLFNKVNWAGSVRRSAGIPEASRRDDYFSRGLAGRPRK